MYGAKKKGKAGYEVFDLSMNIAVHDRLALENDLRGAVERGEFRLYYQPKVCIDAYFEGDGAGIVGVATLIRWEYLDRGP